MTVTVRFLASIFMGVCMLFPAHAQTTFASITGTVTDAAGAVVPGTSIEATHVASNYKYTAVANESGTYTLAQLREGEYTLRARAAGFQEFVVQNIQLLPRDERRIDVSLRVGTVETRIEVTAGATLIETENARIGDSKGAEQLKSMPLNTRSLYSFLALTPGVLAAGGGQATRRFAGSRVNQSEQSIDGISVSNGYDGTQISPLVSYIESYEEVRVDMANNSADIGSVGQVTVISKSGSNDLHGAAFDYYSTPWFRARNPFAAQRGTGVTHQPGVAVGGPVYIPKLYDGRNKTFFFFSFETSRGSSVLQLLNPTVPLEPWRQGDFSALSTVVRDPFANRQPFAGNRVPSSRINPVSQRIQDRFYPLPNNGSATVLQSQNFRQQLLRPYDPNTYYTTRGDHRFSEKSFLFARWTFDRSHSRAYEGNLPTIGRRWQTRDTRALSASYTYTFSPNVIFESRYGMAFNDNPRNGPLMGREVIADLGVTGLVSDLPDINGLLDVQFQGLGIQRITQTQWRHPGFRNFQHQFQEHVNWYRGRHTLKTGFIATYVNFQDSQAPAALFGDVRFSNRFTGFPYGDFLLGIPTSAARAFPQLHINRKRWAYDFFINDDFKMTKSLTVNIGMRYEVHPSWQEAQNRQSVFDVERGAIVVPNGATGLISPLMPTGYVDVIEASTAGLPGGRLIKTDRNNLAPRIGLAWRPWGNNTVFRTGFGLYYDVVPRAENAGGAPFVINEPTFTNPANNPVVIFPQVFPATGGSRPSTVGLPAAIRSDLRIPFSMQYNFTIEHQRWDTGFRLSYIGTNTRQGEWGYNYNQPVPDDRPFVDKPRPFPRYPAITYITNGAGHQYHGAMIEIERRFAKDLGYQFSYTLARDIGDLDRGTQPENAFDRQRERAVWLDIPTHRVTGNFIWSLPFGRGKRFASGVNRGLNAAVGGWEISGIYSYYSGQRATPFWTGPDPVGIAYTTSRTAPNVTIRPDHLRNANLPSDQRSVNRWFDTTAFDPPNAGSFGTAAKNVIIGPDSRVWHVGLYKGFSFGERARLRWELTATNAFNHPNYSLPATNISQASQVGVISGVADTSSLDQSGARSLRTGLRFEW